jgi:hypothetical protein
MLGSRKKGKEELLRHYFSTCLLLLLCCPAPILITKNFPHLFAPIPSHYSEREKKQAKK